MRKRLTGWLRLVALGPMQGNRARVLSNVCWAMGGKITQLVGGLVIGVLVARYLGPSQYGVLAYVISFVTLFTVFAAFGLDNIEVRELARRPQDRDHLLGTALCLRLIFALIAFALTAICVFWVEDEAAIIRYVLVYAATLIWTTMNVVRSYFVSSLRNRLIVFSEWFRTGIGFLLKLMLLIVEADLRWFIWAFAFDALWLGAGLLFFYRRHTGRFACWRFSVPLARSLLAASFPLLLSGAAVIIYQRINEIMLRHYIDAEAVGVFSVASRISEVGLFLPVMMAQTVTPVLADLYQRDPTHYVARRQEFMDVVVWGGLLVSILLSLLAQPVILLLFGSAYAPAVDVLRILAWKAFFIGLFTASGQLIIVEGRQRYAVIRNLMGCILCVVLNMLWIPRWGAQGASAVILITLLLSGYVGHMLIRPYRYLLAIQTRAIFFGWQSLWALIRQKTVRPSA